MEASNATIGWEKQARIKYEAMISRIPLFHREIAKQIVDKKSVENALARGAHQVEEEDILRAFFSEIPRNLYSLMVRLMDTVGFNYRPYEPPEQRAMK